MTPNQWKRLVQKKEIMEESLQKTKLHNISDLLKKYLKDLTWENCRTVFEVRTNMLKLNSNCGQKDEQCYIWETRNNTAHI